MKTLMISFMLAVFFLPNTDSSKSILLNSESSTSNADSDIDHKVLRNRGGAHRMCMKDGGGICAYYEPDLILLNNGTFVSTVYIQVNYSGNVAKISPVIKFFNDDTGDVWKFYTERMHVEGTEAASGREILVFPKHAKGFLMDNYHKIDSFQYDCDGTEEVVKNEGQSTWPTIEKWLDRSERVLEVAEKAGALAVLIGG